MVNTNAEIGAPPMASVSFKTEFAVDMTCDSCVDAVTSALKGIKGVEETSVDLKNKSVVVTGRAPPSLLYNKLKNTGRQVLVRGSGSSTGAHEAAAVAILEAPLPDGRGSSTTDTEDSQQVNGIARMVQVSTNPPLSLLDLTAKFRDLVSTPAQPFQEAGSSSLASGSSQVPRTYDVYVASTGDVQRPPFSTGLPRIHLTTLTPDESGYADAFLELPIGLWDIVGRAMVVEPTESVKLRKGAAQGGPGVTEEQIKAVIGGKGRLGILAGVIARSAGAWGNVSPRLREVSHSTDAELTCSSLLQ